MINRLSYTADKLLKLFHITDQSIKHYEGFQN